MSKVKEQFKPTETMEAYCLPGQTGHFDQIQISFSSYPEQKESCKFVVIPETCDLILDQQIEEET